jgi:hypothetical protein
MSSQDRQLNQAAFRQLSAFIREHYPSGQFLAISGGEIVADAAGFDELNSILDQLGQTSPDVLVVQAGFDHPENVVIFFSDYGGNTDSFWLRASPP